MKKAKFIALLLFAFLTACYSANNESLKSSGIGNTAANTSSIAPTDKGGGGGGGREEPTAKKISLEETDKSQTAPVVMERKIIRNADLNLESDAPEETQQKISAIAESKGGFVIESTQSSSNAKTITRDTVTMTVRVPSAKFDETLGEIRKAASRVIIETVKGQDVTEEFIDIEARLKTQKALEEQFLEIMKRSNSVADALNVQTEIARVRGEIEKIEGRKRFLENQASLSTIKIKLQSPAAFSTNSPGFFYKLKESFGNGFDAALSFILGLVTVLIALLPFLFFIVLPIYVVLRYFWRRRKKRVLANEIAREEIKVE